MGSYMRDTDSTVTLYRLLYEAGRPLTGAEIMDRFSPTARATAYQAWRVKEQALNHPVKENGWTDREKDTAWQWWIGQVIKRSRASGCVTSLSGKGGSGAMKDIVARMYSFNPDHPPTIKVKVLVEQTAKWSPEIGRIGQRHGAGMAFLQAVGPALAQPRIDQAEARRLLELATEAIRALPTMSQTPSDQTPGVAS